MMQLENNNLIIHAGKEIDHMSAERIRREFEECYMTGKVKNVIFDMSDVEFMDSSGARIRIQYSFSVLCPYFSP